MTEIKIGLFLCMSCDLTAEVSSVPKYYMTSAYPFTVTERLEKALVDAFG